MFTILKYFSNTSKFPRTKYISQLSRQKFLQQTHANNQQQKYEKKSITIIHYFDDLMSYIQDKEKISILLIFEHQNDALRIFNRHTI